MERSAARSSSWRPRKKRRARSSSSCSSCSAQAGELVANHRFEAECVTALESAKRLAVLFEGIAEGIVLHDREGNIISTNPAAERILGMSFAELTNDAAVWNLVHEDGSPVA